MCNSSHNGSVGSRFPASPASPVTWVPEVRPLLGRYVLVALFGVAAAQQAQARLVCGQTSVDGGAYRPGGCVWVPERAGGPGGGGGSGGGSTDFQNDDFWGNGGNNTQVVDATIPGCETLTGNPMVMATGNKVDSFLDFQGEGEMALYLERRYNHYWDHPGLFGRHWLSNFDYSLVADGHDLVWAQRPDGRRIRFLWQQSSQRFVEDKAEPVAYLLRHADQSYTLHTEDLMVETYDRFGYVRTVRNRQGIGWTFSYQDNYLQSVTHTGGRSIGFQWTQGRLTRVVDPAGAWFDYGYDLNAYGSGFHRLTTVTLPGPPATVVSHHHELGAFPAP